jgi:hypothetical protein
MSEVISESSSEKAEQSSSDLVEAPSPFASADESDRTKDSFEDELMSSVRGLDHHQI